MSWFWRKREEKNSGSVLKEVRSQGVDPNLLLRAVNDDENYMVTMTDGADGHFTFLTSNSPRFIGYEPEELIGKSSYPYIKEEDHAHVREAVAYVTANDEPLPVNIRFCHKDGHWVVMEIIIWATSKYGRIEVIRFPETGELSN